MPDSYCSLKPLWSGMGEVVLDRTSPTLHAPSLQLYCNYPVSKCPSASTVVTSTFKSYYIPVSFLTGKSMDVFFTFM